MEFQTKWLHREIAHPKEKNTMPSLTQPDEVLSIKEMLHRHARGMPINTGRFGEGDYLDEDEDNFIPDLRTMDLTEIKEYQEMFKERADELKSKIEKSNKEKRDKEQYEKLKQQFEEKQEEQAPPEEDQP